MGKFDRLIKIIYVISKQMTFIAFLKDAKEILRGTLAST